MVERKSDKFDVTGSNPVFAQQRLDMQVWWNGRHASPISIFLSKKVGTQKNFWTCL